MAAKKRKGGRPAPPDEPKQDQFVSVEQFESLADSVGELTKLIKSGILNASPTPAATAEEKEIAKASPNKYTVNPEWEELTREIIGEAVDHTEIEYIKGGGMKFTVVIKNEFSNAPKDYLDNYKVDRRSKEVGAEGEAGVKLWCEQIRNNLKRERPLTFDN